MIKIIKYSITSFIFFIIISLFILYFSLLKGISVTDLNYKFINIGQLYIKIDKKIILKAKNIYIKHENTQNNKNINFKETTTLIKKILQYLSFFQEIHIQNITINQNKINLLSLNKDLFTIDTNDIFINSSLTPKKNKILFTIYEMNIKNIDLILKNINGEFYSDLLYLYVNLYNKFDDTHINLHLKISNKTLEYNGSAKNISLNSLEKIDFFNSKLKKIDLKNLFCPKITFKGNLNNIYITIHKIEGLFKNIKFHSNLSYIDINLLNKIINTNLPLSYLKIDKQKIKLLDTKFIFNINNSHLLISNENIYIKNKNFEINLLNNKIIYNTTLKLNTKFLIVNNANIRIIAKNINGDYTNKLYLSIPNINIKTPIISSTIKQSNIIYNFQTNKAFITNKDIQINYKNLQKIYIQKIKNYINISEKSLFSKITNIKLNPLYIANSTLTYKNNIITYKFITDILLNKKLIDNLKQFNINIPIYQITGKNFIKAELIYNINDNKLSKNIEVTSTKSKFNLFNKNSITTNYLHLNLIDNNLSINHSDIYYQDNNVKLNYYINKGIFDLNNLIGNINGKFILFKIDNILKLNNYDENIYLDLNQNNIKLQNLEISLLLKDNLLLKIDKLSKIYPYIPYLQKYKLKEGNITLIKTNNIINIFTYITDTNQTIFAKNLKPLKNFEINTSIDLSKNIINLISPDINLKILKENNNTIIYGTTQNIDINLTNLIQKDSNSSNNLNIKINIKSQNNYIAYDKMKLYSQNLSIVSNSQYNKSYSYINSLYKDRNITITYNNDELKLYGLKIREKTFQDLTNSNFLKAPLINIYALKNKNSKIIQGFIEIKKGYIKELKVFTNILAFINLIPSLVTFQPVGFTNKGYKIKNGYIEYIFYNKILYFKNINIKGENLTFDAQGYIDLNKNSIKMNVNVNLIIKLVKDIPIVNYILLGKDGGITLKLTIDGNIKDPKVHTNTTSNIIEAPMSILKRAILTPFRPFMEDK